MLLIIGFFFFSVGTFADQDTERETLDSLYAKASKFLGHNRVDSAKQILSLLIHNSIWMDDLSRACKTFNNLGYSFYEMQRYDSSAFYYDKANQAAVELGDTIRIIASFNSLAMAYSGMGLFGLSLEKSQSALDVAKESDNGKYIAQIENTIAQMYFSLGDLDMALFYHRQSLEKSMAEGDSIMISNGYNNLARCHHELGQFDSSLYYYQKAIDLKEALFTDQTQFAAIYSNLASVYLKVDSLEKSLAYFQHAQALRKEAGDQLGLAIGYNGLAELSIINSEFRKANAYIDSGAWILDRIDSKKILSEHVRLNILFLKKERRFEEALSLHERLAILNKEIFEEEKLNVQKAEFSYLLREKELARQSAAQETEFANAANRRYLQLITVLVLSVIVTGILVFYLFRLNAILKLKSSLIALHRTDIIHRTSNVLAQVQAILKIISYGFEKEQREKLQLAESVISSAGQLQEFTYRALDSESRIDLGQYLQTLARNVLETFGHKHSRIELAFDMKNALNVHQTKALNIGIIVSELILNAIKYAFSESHPGPVIFLDANFLRGKLMIQVRDNGRGLPEKRSAGTGTNMIRMLVQQLQGTLEFSTSPEGTSFTLILHKL
jgi:two-component sensor histidine kinase/tetratricopeptide (TPR) repeat protein